MDVDDDRRRTILCIRSRRAGALLDRALTHYDCCVVHDAHIACRKAKLGAFDLYLAVDPHSSTAAIQCWRAMREFDRNTPFVFVVRRRLPAAIEHVLVPGIDASVIYGETASVLSQTLERLIEAAERRSLEARREETIAIREDVQRRLRRLEWRTQLSRESMARAQEHVMRAYALQTFTRLGGTRSFFERMWPEIYEEALRSPGHSSTTR
ncbi:MAG: hypothetical protein ACM3SS_19175 [Rhodospirillaceae bacterium]